MTQSHYSLRWNNHQNHILSAFEALLQAETLVDVTLVCGDTSVRCHKVVLSACSPFFQRIFSENPCKHPVIVLKDFNGWEIQAIVEFMYKGEISVIQEQLQSLIKAAESLQIRGLANQDPFGVDKETNSIVNQTSTPSTSPNNDYDRPPYYPSTGRYHHHPHPHHHHHHQHHHHPYHHPTPGVTVRTPNERISPFSPLSCPTNYESTIKLPHMSRLSFPDTLLPPPPPPLPPTRQECQSPIPRRKQARPRRRSGEMMCNNNNNNNNNSGPQDLSSKPPLTPPHEEIAENLCMKKTRDDRVMSRIDEEPKNLTTTISSSSSSSIITTTTTTTTTATTNTTTIGAISTASSSSSSSSSGSSNLTPVSTPTNLLPPLPPPPATSIRTPDPVESPEMDLSMPSILGGGNNKEFRTSPPVSLPPTLNMKQEIDNHSPLPFPPMPSVSALAMTPPHSKFFGLDSPLGLFPPGLDVRNPLFDMTDPRSVPEGPLFSKKKMGRPKGQHSAPRGGPPRSWTNAELTEALQHVWNKKMTTSQASRIFGIPYNSLLMYVRGKYGKSLKLEQLRKDCIAGPNPPSLDLLNLSGNNNNNNSLKNDRNSNCNDLNDPLQPNTRPSSTEELHQQQQQHPPPPPPSVFNPFSHTFYPDFATGFPIPVSMIHLLPQSEKSHDHYGQPPLSTTQDDDCHTNQKDRSVKKELDDEHDLFRPPTLTVEDRRELVVQQNGQD